MQCIRGLESRLGIRRARPIKAAQKLPQVVRLLVLLLYHHFCGPYYSASLQPQHHHNTDSLQMSISKCDSRVEVPNPGTFPRPYLHTIKWKFPHIQPNPKSLRAKQQTKINKNCYDSILLMTFLKNKQIKYRSKSLRSKQPEESGTTVHTPPPRISRAIHINVLPPHRLQSINKNRVS